MKGYIIMLKLCHLDDSYRGWFVAREMGEGLYEQRSTVFNTCKEAETCRDGFLTDGWRT